MSKETELQSILDFLFGEDFEQRTNRAADRVQRFMNDRVNDFAEISDAVIHAGRYPHLTVKKGDDNNIIFSFMLPGFQKEHLHVALDTKSDPNVLIVKGTPPEKRGDEDTVLLQEYAVRPFERRLVLNYTLDRNRAPRTEFKDGILEVRLPLSNAEKSAGIIPIAVE